MLSFKFFIVVMLLCFNVRFNRADADVDLSPSPEPAGADFIGASCDSATVLYPDLCYVTLSRYAESVGNDRGLLAQAAILVSLSRAKHVSAYVTREAKSGSVEAVAAASALQDCVSSFGDAMDQMKGSLKQMKEIETTAGNGGESLRFWASNVQTWMSAALTNQDTCSDGFESVDEGPLKVAVGRRVGVAKKVTSNALALINRYVTGLVSP